MVKDTHREKAPSNKTPALTKSINMSISAVGTTNQLFTMKTHHGNDALSIIVLSTKKRCSSFLKKVFVFQKIFFKVKVLKTFNIFRLSHKNMPISQREGYFENP